MNSFSFLSRFSISLKSFNNYFCRRFAYKSDLNRFSVLINYIVWSSNHFFTSSCFLSFLGSRLFRVQVFQSPGFWRSRFFRVQVFQGPVFSGLRFSCFSGSRFFRVQVQGPGPGFRSSLYKQQKLTFTQTTTKDHWK